MDPEITPTWLAELRVKDLFKINFDLIVRNGPLSTFTLFRLFSLGVCTNKIDAVDESVVNTCSKIAEISPIEKL